MLAALEGQKAADLTASSLSGLRFATLETVVMDDLRDAPRSAYESAVERLRAAGAVVEAIEAPEVAEAMPLSGILYTSEAYGTWADMIEAPTGKDVRPDP